ncbi:MAG TPA: GT4 family glycosyltransferase PelF, partial [Myxococcaceae bacterium]|nr:GT4 family glycosyltransferase PelF [Myxococcaceae bacterium]
LAAPVPAARTYHALCTGYAGLLGAVWSHRTGRRFLLTEHGIYARERTLELSRAAWVPRRDVPVDERTAAPLQRIWDRFFKSLARCAYSQAWRVVTLSEVNRQRQLADGATPAQTLVIPNGIDVEGLERRLSGAGDLTRRPGPARVGFVGRLVPIKDVGTFIRACALALKTVELEVHVIGPLDEDPAYARRCKKLVEALGLSAKVFFDGPQPLERIYRQLDMVVLTSLSEGQPLVLLEAGAAGIPVIATNVGACRELIYGRDEPDRRIGPSGIVTPLAAPEETAAAIVRLARDPALRRRLGTAGRTRVRTFYRQRDTVDRYRALYREGGGLWLASGGASNA